jgi:hypothetical protein
VYELLLVSLRGAEIKAWHDGFVDSHAGAFLDTAMFEWALELIVRLTNNKRIHGVIGPLVVALLNKAVLPEARELQQRQTAPSNMAVLGCASWHPQIAHVAFQPLQKVHTYQSDVEECVYELHKQDLRQR